MEPSRRSVIDLTMKHLLTLLLATFFAASAGGQSIRTLGFNTTNGQVVANTGTNTLTFTNAGVAFGGDMTISGPVIAGSGVSFSFEDADFAYGASIVRQNLGFSTNLNTLWTATNSSNARSAVGLPLQALTNTNVTNFRTAIGLGATNDAEFNTLTLGGSGQMTLRGSAGNIGFYDSIDAEYVLFVPADTDPVEINSQWNDPSVRSNLGLPLPALTNTSNVTMMRALSGSTNTNHPFSGSVALTNTNTLVFSNGILQSVQ